jgi:hypothetical protein
MAAAATISLTVRLAQEQPWSLVAIATTTLIAVFLRPYIIRKMK